MGSSLENPTPLEQQETAPAPSRGLLGTSPVIWGPMGQGLPRPGASACGTPSFWEGGPAGNTGWGRTSGQTGRPPRTHVVCPRFLTPLATLLDRALGLKDAFFFVPSSSNSQEMSASECQDPKHATRIIHLDSAAPGLQRWWETSGEMSAEDLKD